MAQIETNDHNLEYKLIGEEEGESCIIMLPSFGCHADFCFENLIPSLSIDHNLLLFNHPSHGFSEGPLRVDEMQDSFYDISQKLKERYDRVNGYGHSLGAFVLGSCLDESSTNALVLSGTPITIRDTKVASTLGIMTNFPYPISRTIMWIYDKARLTVHERYSSSNRPYRSEEDECDTYFGAIKMTKDIFEDCKTLVNHDVPIYEGNSNPPRTILIYGNEDDRLGYSSSEMLSLRRKIGNNCKLIVIHGADHNLNVGIKSGKLGFKKLTETKEVILSHYSS